MDGVRDSRSAKFTLLSNEIDITSIIQGNCDNLALMNASIGPGTVLSD